MTVDYFEWLEAESMNDDFKSPDMSRIELDLVSRNVAVDGIVIPEDAPFEDQLELLVQAGEQLVPRFCNMEIDGRAMLCLEMNAILAWHWNAEAAIYERWIESFLTWIGVNDGDSSSATKN